MWFDEAMLAVAEAQLFPQKHTHIFLMNRTELRRRMQAVRDAFDNAAADASNSSGHKAVVDRSALPCVEFLHAFAVKANPLQAVLETVRDAGFAAETASWGEYRLAETILQDPRRVVFDSPAKTLEELRHAIQQPCFLNVDNFTELDRIVALAEGRCGPEVPVRATIGIRVNPQVVASTSIAALLTGAKVSKFGVSLQDPGNRQRLIDAFRTYHAKINLRMLHVHSGSQGLSLQTLVDGVKMIVESLADDEALASLVDVIDIGGGLPVNFAGDEDIVTCAEYANALRDQVPTLFCPTNGKRRLIITEFGRAVAAKSGVMISRVEYTKMSGGRQVVQQHIGADLAVRTVWQPESWPLRVFVYDATGHRKDNNPEERISNVNSNENENKNYADGLTDVVGPCCNSGCMLTRAAALPQAVVALEDLVLVADVGAYYHSSYSLYNLRPMPACYIYEEEAEEGSKLRLVKRAQTVEDIMKLFLSDS